MFHRSISLFLLAAALPLSGCEMLNGSDKARDGESLGFACRISNKLPEDCMKENSTYTPTSILTGWKAADKEALDKQMGIRKDKPAAADAAKTEGEAAPEGDKPTAQEGEKTASPEQQTTH